MNIQLYPIDSHSAQERRAFVAFVNAHYKSEIPLEEGAISSGRYRFFWAREKGKKRAVGVTGFVAKTTFLAETVKTVIDPAFRGKGLGEKLSQLIEDEVRGSGFKKVMTTIYVDNLPMIFIKLKQGYRFEGFHPDHDKPGLHEYSLGKILR